MARWSETGHPRNAETWTFPHCGRRSNEIAYTRRDGESDMSKAFAAALMLLSSCTPAQKEAFARGLANAGQQQGQQSFSQPPVRKPVRHYIMDVNGVSKLCFDYGNMVNCE